MILMIAAALSLSLWLSALNVLFRDIQYIIPFFLQLLMFSARSSTPSTRRRQAPSAW